MGRGDKRSFKGKVFKGSHGKTRPRGMRKTEGQVAVAAAATAAARKR
jgi:ribosomal small subunit protein bTHX